VTRIVELPQTDRRYDEASRWIAKLDRELSAKEEHALQQWLAADAQNATVFLAMAKLWDKMDALSRLSGLFPEPARRRKPSRHYVQALAASLVLAVLAGAWALLGFDLLNGADRGPEGQKTALAPWEVVYETAIGEHSTFTLPDGTEIVLNTNTRISVNYSEMHRLLTLERGEVHVRVAADKARPLSVFVVDKIVQAVGTEFNIRITDAERIELVVTEGKVRVGVREGLNDDGDIVEPVVLPPTSVIVAEREELILGSPDEEITELSVDDIEVKLSWRHGNLIFRGESLEEAVKEIGRYTSVEFVFLDDDLRKVRVAGLFKANDVDGLLAALRENFDIAYQHVDDQTVLLNSQ
jgi:transmembrane sensor